LIYLILALLAAIILGILIVFCMWHSCAIAMGKEEMDHRDLILIEEWKRDN
jgi:hypothetical protein